VLGYRGLPLDTYDKNRPKPAYYDQKRLPLLLDDGKMAVGVTINVWRGSECVWQDKRLWMVKYKDRVMDMMREVTAASVMLSCKELVRNKSVEERRCAAYTRTRTTHRMELFVYYGEQRPLVRLNSWALKKARFLGPVTIAHKASPEEVQESPYSPHAHQVTMFHVGEFRLDLYEVDEEGGDKQQEKKDECGADGEKLT